MIELKLKDKKWALIIVNEEFHFDNLDDLFRVLNQLLETKYNYGRIKNYDN